MSQVSIMVSKNIRKYRKLNNLTQERLADLSGISTEYLSRIEHAKENPSLDVLERLCKSMEISISVLFVEEQEN